MRILSVVGARPQFVKVAPVSRALEERAEHLILHTGQHYDDVMSDVFFRDLGIPAPTANLEVGSGPHGQQTARILEGIERELIRLHPDWVIAYGDTNSTIATALAAVKLHVPLAHLEAGLRSFNRRMPEEHNRVLTDHAADLLLAPTRVAMEHLADEGLAARSVLVGDVMTDVLFSVRDRVVARGGGAPAGLPAGGYYVATLHRPDNTDDPARLRAVVGALASLDRPVALLAHPRLVGAAREAGVALDAGALRLLPPLPYPELIAAVMASAGVVTDSGGLQKEAFLLRVPTTTVRTETEWTETLEGGGNVLANEPDAIAQAVMRDTPMWSDAAPYGDGRAAEYVADAIIGTRS